MSKVKLCASITGTDLAAVKKIEPIVDLFEVRIDLIGDNWTEIARQLKKPWIACNRMVEEGGKWDGNEKNRTPAASGRTGRQNCGYRIQRKKCREYY